MYTIEYTRQAAKQFRDLPAGIRKTIAVKLERLAKDPKNAPEVKALKGTKGYRLRVGDYRVVYILDNGRLVIVVVRVAHRKEVYQ